MVHEPPHRLSSAILLAICLVVVGLSAWTLSGQQQPSELPSTEELLHTTPVCATWQLSLYLPGLPLLVAQRVARQVSSPCDNATSAWNGVQVVARELIHSSPLAGDAVVHVVCEDETDETPDTSSPWVVHRASSSSSSSSASNSKDEGGQLVTVFHTRACVRGTHTLSSLGESELVAVLREQWVRALDTRPVSRLYVALVHASVDAAARGERVWSDEVVSRTRRFAEALMGAGSTVDLRVHNQYFAAPAPPTQWSASLHDTRVGATSALMEWHESIERGSPWLGVPSVIGAHVRLVVTNTNDKQRGRAWSVPGWGAVLASQSPTSEWTCTELRRWSGLPYPVAEGQTACELTQWEAFRLARGRVNAQLRIVERAVRGLGDTLRTRSDVRVPPSLAIVARDALWHLQHPPTPLQPTSETCALVSSLFERSLSLETSPGLLPPVFFPLEHVLAVVAPLWAPLVFAILSRFVREFKRRRAVNKEADTCRTKT
jgi:hypothetical protein